RPGEIKQRHDGSLAMRLCVLGIEFRMALEVYDPCRLRTAGAVRHNYDILPAWLQAMRRSEHEVARDRGPGAGCAAAADHDHHVARNRLGRGLCSANNSSPRPPGRQYAG